MPNCCRNDNQKALPAWGLRGGRGIFYVKINMIFMEAGTDPGRPADNSQMLAEWAVLFHLMAN